MLRSTRFHAVLFLAAGALLGYATASGRLALFQPADAAALSPEAGPPAGLQADAEQAITFEVLLPADAVRTIDGSKTTETGEVRDFQTPPLKVGGRYNYTLSASAGGRTVKRQIHLTHGAANTIDLRPDFQEAGAGKPKPAQLA